VAPSGECSRCYGRAYLIGLFAELGTVCFWQTTPSVLNLIVAAVLRLRDSVGVSRTVAALHDRLSLYVVYCMLVRLSGLP